MLSYQANKRYSPGSPRSVPDVGLIQHATEFARLPSDVQVRMMVVHQFIFWCEEVYGTVRPSQPCAAICTANRRELPQPPGEPGSARLPASQSIRTQSGCSVRPSSQW